MTSNDYRNSVMRWGNEKPWKGEPNLSHKDVISPHEVILDDEGNILAMPLLRKKPCFGRPETFLRHGDRVRKVTNHFGKLVDSSSHQCGSCPSLTHETCGKVVKQRVIGNPKIHDALRAWLADCDVRHNGEKVYTKESGKPWVAFKEAIAERGPFTSSNDGALLQEEARQAAVQTEKWKRAKRRQRARDKKEREQVELHTEPTRQFIENAMEERNDRFAALRAVLGRSDQHKSRSKVREADRDVTAALTANGWFVREILRESDPDVREGTIARRMITLDLNEGKSLATLKARIHNDLHRGDRCVREGVWHRFDRDSDLDAYEAPDDDAADSLSDPTCSDETLAMLV